jgi:hypothetical protein
MFITNALVHQRQTQTRVDGMLLFLQQKAANFYNVFNANPSFQASNNHIQLRTMQCNSHLHILSQQWEEKQLLRPNRAGTSHSTPSAKTSNFYSTSRSKRNE